MGAERESLKSPLRGSPLLVLITGQDEHLLHILKICRRGQKRILGHPGLVKAGVSHIPQNEVPGIQGGTGCDHRLIVPDHSICGQVVHPEHSLRASGVSALHHTGIAGGGDVGAHLQGRVQHRGDCGPVTIFVISPFPGGYAARRILPPRMSPFSYRVTA